MYCINWRGSGTLVPVLVSQGNRKVETKNKKIGKIVFFLGGFLLLLLVLVMSVLSVLHIAICQTAFHPALFFFSLSLHVKCSMTLYYVGHGLSDKVLMRSHQKKKFIFLSLSLFF